MDEPTSYLPTPEPTEALPSIAIPSKFATLSKRNWQLLVKSPDKYTGKGYSIWGCIWQFDAATGEEEFLGHASYRKESYWSLNGENAAFVGPADKLAKFVEGDLIQANVVDAGSYSYETQIGGSTTVPLFYVAKITRKGSCQ